MRRSGRRGARHPDDLPDLLAQDEPQQHKKTRRPRKQESGDGGAEDSNGQQRFPDDFEGFDGPDA